MILYQDDHLIVLNKPYGLPVQGGPGISRHVDGMLEGLRNDAGDRPRLVHRLDRDTTGLLLIARTAGCRRQTRRRVSRPRHGEDVLGCRRRPAGAGGGRDRPPAETHWRRARRAHRSGRARRRGGRPRHHRIPHAGSRGPQTRLAGTEAAYRPHPPASRPLRRHSGAHTGRREIRRVPTRTTPSRRRSPVCRRRCICTRAALVFPHPAGGTMRVEADLPPHMAETFHTLGFSAPPGAQRRGVRGADRWRFACAPAAPLDRPDGCRGRWSPGWWVSPAGR